MGRITVDAKTVRLGAAALLAVAFLAILAADLLGDSSEDGPTQPAGSLVELSESELLARADQLRHRAYWLGVRPGVRRYELSTDRSGAIFVRYLTGAAAAGDPRADFVTVGTYPVPEARRSLRHADATDEDATISRHGGFEALTSASSNSAYVVFDDEPELQIEVFSPSPGEARALATSGALSPLD